MSNNKFSYIVLLSQKIHRLFCFYNISSKTMEEYETMHGAGAWNSSLSLLKLYYINHAVPQEKEVIVVPPFNYSWYFDIPEDNITAFVTYLKVTPSNTFETILTSNIITSPSDQISLDESIKYVDINNPHKLQAITEINTPHKPQDITEINNSKQASPALTSDQHDFFVKLMRNSNFKDLNSSR